MSRRLVSVAFLAIALCVVHGSAALAHGGTEEDAPLFSMESRALPMVTSFALGAICFAVMVLYPDAQGKDNVGPKRNRAKIQRPRSRF
jgi:hypothetical protein